MNESMETCEAKATRKIQNEPARHFSDDKQTATARKSDGERRKNQAPHVPRLCSVVVASPGCIHILGAPLCHDFDSAASKSTQVDAMRCDATRLESSRVILHLKCRQRVLLSQRQGLRTHTEKRREREKGNHWPNWLRDREFLTENRSTFIFCLFDTFATFLLTVLMEVGGKKGDLTSWQSVAPHQILILKNRITSLKFVNNVLENLLAKLPPNTLTYLQSLPPHCLSKPIDESPLSFRRLDKCDLTANLLQLRNELWCFVWSWCRWERAEGPGRVVNDCQVFPEFYINVKEI